MMSSQSTAKYRFLKLDNEYYLQLRLTVLQGKIFSVNQVDLFFLKLKNDLIIELKNFQYVISSPRSGATGIVGSSMEGVEVTYPLNDADIQNLLLSELLSSRVQTSQGYIEDLNLKEKISKILKKSLDLIIETKL